jgi:hypothetical protein
MSAISPVQSEPAATRDLRAPGRVLLVSCYELGHQPLALATAAGALRDAGFDPATRDLAVDSLSDADLASAGLVAVSVPMDFSALRQLSDASSACPTLRATIAASAHAGIDQISRHEEAASDRRPGTRATSATTATRQSTLAHTAHDRREVAAGDAASATFMGGEPSPAPGGMTTLTGRRRGVVSHPSVPDAGAWCRRAAAMGNRGTPPAYERSVVLAASPATEPRACQSMSRFLDSIETTWTRCWCRAPMATTTDTGPPGNPSRRSNRMQHGSSSDGDEPPDAAREMEAGPS